MYGTSAYGLAQGFAGLQGGLHARVPVQACLLQCEGQRNSISLLLAIHISTKMYRCMLSSIIASDMTCLTFMHNSQSLHGIELQLLLRVQMVSRGMGGDLEFDDPGPPGVKPRSERVAALGASPIPAEAPDLEQGIPSAETVAESPLEELPLNTNQGDANPYRGTSEDPLSAERELMGGMGLDDSGPNDSELQAEEAAILRDMPDDEPHAQQGGALDFDQEDPFGPAERSTTGKSQSISFVCPWHMNFQSCGQCRHAGRAGGNLLLPLAQM